VLLVWLGELITEYGIGNGVSLIIFSGIVSGLPGFIGQTLLGGTNIIPIVAFIAIGAVIVYAIVIFNEAQRRVPVQYSRSTMRGGRVFRQGSTTHIPLKVNMAGMIPLLFALTLMILPQTLLGPFVASDVAWVRTIATTMTTTLSQTSPLYWIIYFVLVVGFTFFYTLIIFQQQNLSESLQNNGGFIPGIRPGRATSEYLNTILNRITWAGALFLGAVAITPYIAELFTGVRSLQLSSTGLLIVVGVVLDTMKQLEAQLLMRRYQGFLS
jgi:preprotein translocase subunit SecY